MTLTSWFALLVAIILAAETVRALRQRALGNERWRRFFRHPTAAWGLVILVFLVMVAVAAPLPPHQAQDLATLFRALADPTRVQMLHMLKTADEPICVCDFTAVFNLGQPTVSHHLARLKDAGLVSSSKRGVWSFFSLANNLSPAARQALSLVP